MISIITSFKLRILLRTIMVIFCFLVFGIVYFTGGVQYVFPHIMYIPIVISAVLLGTRDGILIAILGGLLLGPYMPIDVSLNHMQSTSNWIIRLLFFVLIAVITGYSVKIIKRLDAYRFEINSPLTSTKIPLRTQFYEKMNALKKDIKKHTIILLTIKIINYDDLNDLLSEKIYSNILKEAYRRLNGMTDSSIFVYARDMQSFLVIIINQSDISGIIKKIRTRLIVYPMSRTK